MRSYWLRILIGAMAVFAVGMIVVSIVRHTKERVRSVVMGSGPLTIPLPFVPFELEGSKLGQLERLVVNREAPKKVSSVDLEVKLDDSLLVQGLAGCRLAANLEGDSVKSGDINIHTGRRNDGKEFFFCAKADSGLVEFGTVSLHPGDVTVPLLVPASLAEDLRAGRWADHENPDSVDLLAERAESLADKAEDAADSLQAREERRAAALRIAGSRLGDSLRKVGLMRADSIRTALGHMADSLEAR